MILVRITNQEFQKLYVATWTSNMSSYADDTYHEIQSTEGKYALIPANGPSIKVPFSALEKIGLPFLPHNKDGQKIMIINARTKSDKNIYDLAYDYGNRRNKVGSGSDVTVYYVDNNNVKIQYRRNKPFEISLNDLENDK